MKELSFYPLDEDRTCHSQYQMNRLQVKDFLLALRPKTLQTLTIRVYICITEVPQHHVAAMYSLPG